MGDVVSLVEKAEEAIQADEAAELARRMMTGAARRRGGPAGRPHALLHCCGLQELLNCTALVRAASRLTRMPLLLPLPRPAAKFDFNDFLKQYKMVTGMGSMSSIVKMMPGAGSTLYCALRCTSSAAMQCCKPFWSCVC